ncbi:Elongation factor [Cinnamomum micranthum f. kanehirae]|uniref:Eukaryotic translation initiation factor 5B n=1 Tax=Cinnamomum micranthum f. kanehirae TaxID=337451 RepID=A0A3S3MMU2_9MAGN|nr:Elongation factor [Cinnamomum micranthum f. kanehirae]
MRKQYLGDKAQLPVAKIETSSSKRPKFEKRKAKPGPLHGHSGEAAEAVETLEVLENKLNSMPLVFESPEVEMVEKESSIIDIKQWVVEENEIEEDDDVEEWDAKSWDDVDIILPAKSAFPEEEAESMVKKDTKHLTASDSKNAKVPPPPANPTITTKKAALPVLAKSQATRSKGEDHEVEEAKEKTERKEAAAEQEQFAADSLSKRSADNLRSPICCILGHVDTGKTKLLDCIRGTNVQGGEAGGITQQIGATYFPAENIRERTKELKADAKLRVPGLLVIDTPGHESFTNLRSRGSGLCDIAILVVDIMHGLEPQTIESINLLKMRKTEFIVALNKVDRLYGWKTCPNAPIVKAMKQQSRDVQNEFKMRLTQCTVLEVKVIEGLGTTVDVVLINGILHEGDQIVVCGMQGPIVTTIRALLTPHPMKELRVKGSYQHHKELKAAQGIKITAQGLEHAIAGTGLYVVGPGDDVEFVKEAAMEDMNTVMSRMDKSGEGVSVQASTLGSLEALLEFLRSPAVNIPVSGISIGPVHKRDVVRASVMLERKKEYGTILAFDVKVTPEARELADETGVKIFIADIIYHLFDQFKAYIDNLKEEKKKETAEEAVFPCKLKIMPDCIFNKKDPIVVGVDILDGIAKVGTPICIPSKGFTDIGRITSIEINHKQVDVAKKGQQVAIKIVGSNPEEQQKMFGRHFDINDELVSHISSRSIDILKANYKDDLSREEWKLVKELKKLFLDGESMRFFQ